MHVNKYRSHTSVLLSMFLVSDPESSPLPPGHYIQSGACLKVKVEVAYPLVTPTQLAAKVDVEPTIEVKISGLYSAG